MLHEIATNKKGASSIYLAEKYGLNQKSAWLFRYKASLAMNIAQDRKLKGLVEVDEFEIGSLQKGEEGRKKKARKR